MLIIFDLDGTLFQAKPIAELIGRDFSSFESLERLTAALKKCGKLFPGVYEMLSQLRKAGHNMVICSKSQSVYVDLVLEQMGIAEFFTDRFSTDGESSKVGLVKEIIYTILAGETDFVGGTCCVRDVDLTVNSDLTREGVEGAVVIGDTHWDISSAKENGLSSIAAMYGYGNKSMLSDADYFADSPSEIPTIVDEINAKKCCEIIPRKPGKINLR